MEEIVQDKINWDLFADQYFKPTEEPVDITFKDWMQCNFDINGQLKPGIKADIIVKNGSEVKQEWRITAKRLIRLLRPIIEKAETESKRTVSIRVFKQGSGMQTQFVVKPL